MILTLDPLALFILALAVYRVTRVLILDTIFNGPRDRIFNRFPPETTKIGYLFTCFWCMSIWVAIPAVLLYVLFPTATIIVGLVFAFSAITGAIDHLLSR